MFRRDFFGFLGLFPFSVKSTKEEPKKGSELIDLMKNSIPISYGRTCKVKRQSWNEDVSLSIENYNAFCGSYHFHLSVLNNWLMLKLNVKGNIIPYYPSTEDWTATDWVLVEDKK